MRNSTVIITSILIKFCCDEYFSDVLLLVDANLMKLKNILQGFKQKRAGISLPPTILKFSMVFD